MTFLQCALLLVLLVQQRGQLVVERALLVFVELWADVAGLVARFQIAGAIEQLGAPRCEVVDRGGRRGRGTAGERDADPDREQRDQRDAGDPGTSNPGAGVQ